MQIIKGKTNELKIHFRHYPDLSETCDGVRMPLHQLLKGHGLHVKGTGDLPDKHTQITQKTGHLYLDNPSMLRCVSRPVVGAVGTHINGATQQRASLQGFGNDAVQVFGSFTQLVHLGHATCEVLKTFGGGTSGQSFIWAMQPTGTCTRYGLYYCRIEEEEEERGRDSLGIGLLQKSTPELISFCWVNKH